MNRWWVAAAAKPAPMRTPLGVAEKASWTAPEGTTWLDVRGGLAIAENLDHLTLLDAVTGEQRWRLTAYEDLPGTGGVAWKVPAASKSRLVAHGGGLAVLTTYSLDADEEGLMLLSTEDASVLWRTPLARGPAGVRPRRGRRPGRGRGDEVRPGLVDAGRAEETATALDLTTGATRWDLSRYSTSGFASTGGGTVLAEVWKDALSTNTVLLDARDGRLLLDLDTEEPASDCATDGDLVACASPTAFTVYDVATGKPAKLTSDALGVDAVRDGRSSPTPTTTCGPSTRRAPCSTRNFPRTSPR